MRTELMLGSQRQDSSMSSKVKNAMSFNFTQRPLRVKEAGNGLKQRALITSYCMNAPTSAQTWANANSGGGYASRYETKLLSQL
ncbi:hypothetical protein CEXT_332301 [Caerostris extrusa]|uniref:Uncharacterized protein n=1 Tax=Caerostris extrusa TaxID=172846 RepID=A0AAV4RDR6_CAEEX|nr:hypothetical protein CEXT_332301 [Caerostris extrusa]